MSLFFDSSVISIAERIFNDLILLSQDADILIQIVLLFILWKGVELFESNFRKFGIKLYDGLLFFRWADFEHLYSLIDTFDSFIKVLSIYIDIG